jgi:hypothetical protein
MTEIAAQRLDYCSESRRRFKGRVGCETNMVCMRRIQG